MSTRLSLINIIPDYLKTRPEEKLTAREIAQWVFETYPEACQEKKNTSKNNRLNSDNDLIQQLASEISPQRKGLKKRHVKTTEGRPRRYYWSDKSDGAEITVLETPETETTSSTKDARKKYIEHDLYPLLSRYLWEEFELYQKRIDEKRSSNRHGSSGNHWLHPDLVGMEDLSKEWDQEVRNCVRQFSDKRTRLWAFEVKRLINRSNVRESFFQAVSNSSWANFGYLVAAEIGGVDTLKELRMLSAAHGIGVINLDIDNPGESQVLIPARERNVIDWDMVNRLAVENADFIDYVKSIRHFYQTGDVRKKDWDIIPDSENT